MEPLLAAPWISRALAFGPSRSTPVLAFGAVPGSVLLPRWFWCCRPGRAAGKAAGIPRVAVALTGEAERKKGCQGLPGRGP